MGSRSARSGGDVNSEEADGMLLCAYVYMIGALSGGERAGADPDGRAQWGMKVAGMDRPSK